LPFNQYQTAETAIKMGFLTFHTSIKCKFMN